MTKHYNSLLREVVEAPSLEILKSHRDMFLCNLLWGNCFSGGVVLYDL